MPPLFLVGKVRGQSQLEKPGLFLVPPSLAHPPDT